MAAETDGEKAARHNTHSELVVNKRGPIRALGFAMQKKVSAVLLF